jgi:hypothetical protein
MRRKKRREREELTARSNKNSRAKIEMTKKVFDDANITTTFLWRQREFSLIARKNAFIDFFFDNKCLDNKCLSNIVLLIISS